MRKREFEDRIRNKSEHQNNDSIDQYLVMASKKKK